MLTIDSEALQKFYIAYFGRPADPSGINYWLSHLQEPLTLTDISYQLSLQDEYINFIIKGKTLEYQINRFYLNLFNRKADFEKLNHYMQMINDENSRISDILCHIILSVNELERIDSSQAEKDLKVIENKIYAAGLFTEQISKNISLINLYQPESIKPWISGRPLMKASNFLSTVSSYKVSLEEINTVIHSLSDESIEMLTNPAIEMANISLNIPVYTSENRSLSKRLTKKIINITGGKITESKEGTSVIALNKINLKIMNGERVALIGHNGSGKSSFLRLISGIYRPTNGQLKIHVDVYPMLQKTFLTSPGLSGIDACKAHYLLNNHSLIGFDDFLDDIITFSGLGDYITLPIKTYSDGMSARLIFSILTSSHHDCLAIDEGFGTGDADFFDRAEERMKKFMDSAGTLFLASHSDQLLKQFCNRGIVFSHGSIVYDGSIDAALNYYHTHDYYNENVIR